MVDLFNVIYLIVNSLKNACVDKIGRHYFDDV